MQKLKKLQYNNVIQWAHCKIPTLWHVCFPICV